MPRTQREAWRLVNSLQRRRALQATLEHFAFLRNQSSALGPCLVAFSSREPVSTSLENALDMRSGETATRGLAVYVAANFETGSGRAQLGLGLAPPGWLCNGVGSHRLVRLELAGFAGQLV